MKKYENGLLYFYIHMVTEIVCFYFLTISTNYSIFSWILPFAYDSFAFVPQSLIGYFSDKFPKINLSLVGILLLCIGISLYLFDEINITVPLLLLCFGNCLLHVNGAKVTLESGCLSNPAIFVGGGSFGLIIGKMLARYNVHFSLIYILLLSTIPFIILAEYNYKEINNKKINNKKKTFNYVKKNLSPVIVVLLTMFIIIARGYIGYGIPTSWKKTILETLIFYIFMGIGKCLGGILSDRIGIKKVAISSCLLAIPFLCLGDNLMIISIIGVMLFSMTMSITLGILVSILKNNYGLSFGLTTISLFLGTAPIFFIQITNDFTNIILIIIISIICALIFNFILEKENN